MGGTSALWDNSELTDNLAWLTRLSERRYARVYVDETVNLHRFQASNTLTLVPAHHSPRLSACLPAPTLAISLARLLTQAYPSTLSVQLKSPLI